MTGMSAYFASSSMSWCANVRIMMPSTYRESTRAVSAIGSPRPSCTSRGDRKSAWPPSCHAPTSNDTRVRVDDFMKIIPSDFPASGLRSYLPFLIDSASVKSFSISSAEKSGIWRRSRWGRSLGDIGLAWSVKEIYGWKYTVARRGPFAAGEPLIRNLVCLAFLVCATSGCGSEADTCCTPLPPDLVLELEPLVTTGLTSPVFLTQPLNDGRIFVVEQPGRIRIRSEERR